MSVTHRDLQIIRCLQRNPRATNKAIAREVGVTEQTVASRIQALVDGGVFRVMAQRDLGASGYTLLGFVEAHVEAASPHAVAAAMADMDETFSVSICPGSPEVIANVNVERPEQFHAAVERIGSISGVSRCDLTVCHRVDKFTIGAGDLSNPIRKAPPAVTQEPLDEQIIELLMEDGRVSNREVARRLNVSEGTVRMRLKRMTERGVIRLGVVCEPNRVGYAHAAYIFFNGAESAVSVALSELAEREEVGFAAAATGAHAGVLLGMARDPDTLPRLCTDVLRQRPDIQAIEFRPLFRVLKHRFDYVCIGRETAFLDGGDDVGVTRPPDEDLPACLRTI